VFRLVGIDVNLAVTPGDAEADPDQKADAISSENSIFSAGDF